MNRKRWLAVGAGAAILVAVLLFTVNRNATNNEAEAQEAETAVAVIGDLSASATASGQLLPQREAVLAANTTASITEVAVRLGDVVQPGDLLVQLDTTDLQFDVANAEQSLALAQARLDDLLAPAAAADIANAEAALASAQAQLDDLLAGPSETEIALSEAAIDSAEAQLYTSVADLNSSQNSIDQSQITAAQANLLAAQQQLDRAVELNEENPTEANHQARMQAEQAVANAQAQLDALLAGPDVAASQNSVAAANARVEGSEIDLDSTLAGATAAEIANAEAAVAQQQANLADLLAGPTAEQIRAAEAEVAQAELNLADAEEALAEASIVAPFAGVVTAVYVSEGEIASGPVIELVDSNSLELVLSVDEVDIGSFDVGQPAIVTLEAWPEREFESKIVTIAPSASDENSALVTYNVHLAYQADDLPTLIGLTANANLITAQRDDVLLVPNAAITPDRAAGKYFVDVQQADGTFRQVEVAIGLRDGENTQITAGLAEGDILRLVTSQPTEEIDGPGPFGGG
ncbi:efflux RND transporter periplasmic adaptor subunit [Candidatus Leptofilum sp.]|uniref:efflux RND transporter periplasmic adaptor subunit n=1 Tax=Candidatus Leptofilum sp. TaxID=3241576 RepID=UPI003B5A3BEB